jgi:cytochrome c556
MMNKILLPICILLLSWQTSLAAEEITLSQPPGSLAQWYKPAAKRHVWLHNMFKLRREFQAVKTYSAAKDQPHTLKWTDLLIGHYRKIKDMVPEWEDELDLATADKLTAAASAGDFAMVDKSLKKLSHSCNSCHREYRAVAVALYRTPDYSKIQVTHADTGKTSNFKDYMVYLQELVNAVVINMQDDNMQAASATAKQLEQDLEQLKPSCNSCHKNETAVEYYLGEATRSSLEKLSGALSAGDKKLAGRAIGETALNACAHCHGVHRALYDLSGLLK